MFCSAKKSFMTQSNYKTTASNIISTTSMHSTVFAVWSFCLLFSLTNKENTYYKDLHIKNGI